MQEPQRSEYLASAYPSMACPVRMPLQILPEHDCPYMPGRTAQIRAFGATRLAADAYHDLMDAGFRRTGTTFYQPICRHCRRCQAIRIPVERYSPSKSQRRAWQRNQDLSIVAGKPDPTTEKYQLYCRYTADRHKAQQPDSRQAFRAFLYESPVQTVEMTYRDVSGRLLAVGICDVSVRSLSSVYFYFDPGELRRGLGTFGAMCEIAAAQRMGIGHYYLGYWVPGCRAMQYKQSFRPFELLDGDGVWRSPRAKD